MNIKQRLKDKKITQTHLAKMLGVNERTIRKWIKGDRTISTRTLLAIEYVLGNNPTVTIGNDKYIVSNYIKGTTNHG